MMIRAYVRRALVMLVTAAVVLLASVGSTWAADGRQYELVSPPDTGGFDVNLLENNTGALSPGPRQPSTMFNPARDDGNAVAFFALPLPGYESSGNGEPYIARRMSTGWETEFVGPVQRTRLIGYNAVGFTQDFGKSLLWGTGLEPDPADIDPQAGSFSYSDLYLRQASGDLTWLSRGSLQEPISQEQVKFAAATTDASHVVFTTNRQIEASAPPSGGPNVSFLYERAGAVTRYVGIKPDRSSFTTGQTFGGMSADGSRIVFVAAFGSPATDRVFVRIDGGRTVEASASRKTSAVTPAAVRPEGIATDGSVVFFSTTQPLTDDDADTTRDIYAYDVDQDTLTLVSSGGAAAGSPGNDPGATCTALPGENGCGVLVAATTPDGSAVYFVSPEQLDGSTGQANQPNLYVYADGVTRYVGTLLASDLQSPRLLAGTGGLPTRHLRVTADGSKLIFESAARLTTYNNAGVPEVYVFDRPSVQTSCASCRPDGAPPTQPAQLRTFAGVAAKVTAVPNATADGRHVFFDTAEPLVREDVNSTLDVYDYDTVDGTVSLISAGKGNGDSLYATNTPDGQNVFFLTTDTLVPQDRNGRTMKLYDARVGGGFPFVGDRPACVDDGCQPAPSAAPTSVLPGSTSIAGPGNPTPKHKVTPFTARRPSLRQRRAAARTGKLTLTVRVRRAGRISARARARIGGRTRTVAHVSRQARGPSTVHLRLRLTRGARHALGRGRAVRLHIHLAMKGVGHRQTITITLRRATRGRS